MAHWGAPFTFPLPQSNRLLIEEGRGNYHWPIRKCYSLH